MTGNKLTSMGFEPRVRANGHADFLPVLYAGLACFDKAAKTNLSYGNNPLSGEFEIHIHLTKSNAYKSSLTVPMDHDPSPHVRINSIDADNPGHGVVKAFMPQLIAFTQTVNRPLFRMLAINEGRYTWIRYGFVPTEARNLNLWQQWLQQDLKNRALARQLSAQSIQTLTRAACNLETDPRLVRAIAAVKDPVTIGGVTQSFGRYFFLGHNAWDGEMDVRPGSPDRAYCLQYCAER